MMSRKNSTVAHEPEIIVCSIDYDGCVSVESPGDHSGNMRTHLHNLLIQHSRAHLVLMVGSARQSLVSELFHEQRNKNGSCWVFLKSFVESFKSNFPDLSDRISLDPLLLEDIVHKQSSGYHFNIRVNEFSEELKDEVLKCNSNFKKGGISIGWQDITKKTLVYAQLHHISAKHAGKKIAFHFYDDWDRVLEGLYGLYASQLELIPNTVYFRVFKYVAGQFYGNALIDVKGVGFVDHNYLSNVQKLHASDWLSSHHAELFERMVHDPNIELATHLYYFAGNKDDYICDLRKAWGHLVFKFLDNLKNENDRKLVIIEKWLSEAVKSKDIEFISHCLRYVNPNKCVNYFIEALEKNDDLLAGAFVPILNSCELGELSRGDINLLLFSKKKYDWLKNQPEFSHGFECLIQWCCQVDVEGLKKSSLKNLLDDYFIGYQALPLLIDLRRFCYHLSVLKDNELTPEDRFALRVIVLGYVGSDHCFVENLLAEIILARLPTGSRDFLYNAEEIKQKYLQAIVVDYPSEIQKIMIEKIQRECRNPMNEEALTAYRALRFAILSIPSCHDVKSSQLYDVITRWKNSESIILGKTHGQLLAFYDDALKTAATSFRYSVLSFFCCCCDKNESFSHVEFVDSLPKVVMDESFSKKSNREVFSYQKIC